MAEQFIAKARQHGSETVWPYYYAGTMGLVQRDGINRLRHAMKYSRWFSTICVTLSDTGWIAGVGAKRGADVREVDEHSGPGGDLGRQPGQHPGQRHDPRHARQEARREAGRGRSLPHRHGRAGRHPSRACVPAPTARWRSRVMHVLFKEGYADWDYLRRYTDAPDELAAHVATRTPEWASTITGLSVDEIVSFARLYGRTRGAASSAAITASAAAATAPPTCTPSTCLPAVTGAWKYKGGGALYGHTGMYPINRRR